MDIPQSNKESILKFDKIGKQNKLSPYTRIYRLKCLRTFMKHITKEFDKVTDNDVLNFLDKWRIYNGNEPSDNLKSNMKINLKLFFTWLNNGKVPKCVSWIVIKRRQIQLKDEIITPIEIKEMVNVCDNARDKALLSFMYDSGVRASELLRMTIKDVKPDAYGCLVTVINAKTRGGNITKRTIRVVDSVPYILLWLRVHPFKDKENHAFWISTGRRNYGEPLKHSSLLSLLRKIKKRSGIKKRIFPHLFRHSCATRMSQMLYEHEMNTYFGWSNQSKMGYHYCHMTAENVNDKIAKVKGGKDKDVEQKDELEPIECPRCETMNPPDAKFCFSCSFGLDKKETMEMDDVNEFMNWFVKDKDFKELVELKKKEWKK